MFRADLEVKDDSALLTAKEDAEELPLPPDFKYGAATAAYQIEGAAFEDGKGPSTWDIFAHQEPSRTNGQHGDVACDHYHKLEEDVALLASYGVDTYRFSICWSRLIPLGGRNDPINEKGIAFYNDLIDRLLKHNIQPMATLFHWDLPQELETRYGGVLNTTEFTADFENYARLCFERFGDRVTQWVTFNEPFIVSIFGYLNGWNAPGHCEATGHDTTTEPWLAGHNLIIAHAKAVVAYDEQFKNQQGGTVTIVLNGDYYEPFDRHSDADRAAAQRRMEFYIGWFADPIYLGKDYPISMRNQLGSRLPDFSEDQKELLRRSAKLHTFYGMNHYTSQYARARSEPPAANDWTGNVDELPANSDGVEIGPLSGTSWLRVTPHQFRKLMKWIWTRYSLPIYVTENGCPCPGENQKTVTEAVEDDFRVSYFQQYLNAISRVIYEDGVVVKGYYAWSLMDNYGKYRYHVRSGGYITLT
jgi:beta-glucosidase